MSNESSIPTAMSQTLPPTHTQQSTRIQDPRLLNAEDLSSKRKPPEKTQQQLEQGEAFYSRAEFARAERQLVAENIYLDGKINEELLRTRESRSTAMSTAEDWFKDFNRDVQENNNLAGYDDDPPYYLPNSSIRRKHHLPFKQHRPHKLSRISPSGAVLRGSRVRQGSSSKAPTSIADGNVAPGWGAQVESTSDSNSDSYRSVIDDLTIKNQKLKKRLKRLEELQAEHLQTDKLFELRIHGLSVSKRQELESLLQQFASTLHASPSSSSSVPTSASPPTSSGSPFVTQSVQTFDSAYASGMGGIHGATCANTSSQPSLLSGKSGDTNSISSSDHSKPSSLNKKDITFTSEKAKMKTVVKRLEQLFTGRQPRGQHARSPQDLMRNSQLSDESVPEEEGAREAPLMEVRPMNPTTASTPTDDSDLGSPSRPAIPEVVDQRPTRPGDLDPRRPQIPEQNLEYLHNLTTSSAPAELLLEDHWDGWVYLNLINNLAQLHTINVTLPFVKKAISTMSTKLELSPDGKMVRWKGGSEGSKLSSDSGSRSESASTGSPIDSQSDVSRGRKRDASISSLSDGIMGNSKLESLKFPASQESSATRMSSSNSRSVVGTGQRSRASGSSDFHYKPLFAQEKSTDDDSSDLETTSSASSDMKSSSSPDSGDTGDRIRTRKKTTGPIIFYENGNFCTDLSTQELRAENISAEYPYERMTNEVVGAPTLDNGSFRARNLKSKFPLQTVFEGETLVKRGLGESGNSEQDDEEDEGCVIDFSPTLDSTLPDHQLLPIELEASGIGGVQPEDNFAINVQMKHYILPKNGRHTQEKLSPRKMKSKVRGIIHRIPQSSIDVFLQDENGGSGTTRTSGRASHGHNPSPSPPHSTCSSSDGPPSPPPLRHEIVSARFIRLPPSSLPPALFYSPSSDESSRDSDSGKLSRSSGSPSGGSDYYMDSQAGDDLTDDSQDNERGRKSTGGFVRSSTAGSSRLGGSVGSGKLVVGRERRSSTIPTESSAATAGSRGDSIMGDQDSDDIMDDYGLGKSSDSDGQDSYEGNGDHDRTSPKWTRGLKHQSDSPTTMRQIIPA